MHGQPKFIVEPRPEEDRNKKKQQRIERTVHGNRIKYFFQYCLPHYDLR
jgi:hypothetical protein